MKILSFIKKEIVLFVAVVLAIVSVCVIRPSFGIVLASVDFRVLALLFSLMIVIQAFSSINLLDCAASALLRLCKNTRILYFVMTFLVFVFSMFVTNDVALLTFIPLTILLCSKADLKCMMLVILETVSANLGSCVTPMGNPQNLFLYSFYDFGAADFFSTTLKIAVPSVFLLAFIILFLTRGNNNSGISIKLDCSDEKKVDVDFKFILYVLDFVLLILTVFRIVDYRIALGVTVVVICICNISLFKKVDYSILFTFTGFFIFTGTVSTIPAISNFLRANLSSFNSTYAAGILFSQIISNVPAALLLSKFTAEGKALVLGVNAGGLGTLIASLASLISFKIYKASEEGKSAYGKSYFKCFTVMNVVLLAVIGFTAYCLCFLLRA